MDLPPAPVHIRRDCRAIFNYVDPKFSREYLSDPRANQGVASPLSAWGHVTKPVAQTVEDVGGREDDFTLDQHGFMFWRSALRYDGPIDDYARVKAEYWPEVEALVREAIPTATDVRVYNTVPRSSNGRSPVYKGEFAFARNERHDQVYKAHVDQDAAGALDLVREAFPNDDDEAAARLRKRFQVLNVWRPVVRPVSKDPLAVLGLDSAIAPDDLARVGTLYPNGRKGALLAPRVEDDRARQHRWYYKYRQRPDEVLLFLQFDNAATRKCWGHVAHSSFVDEDEEARNPAAKHPRVSLEARALVFYADQEGEVPPEEEEEEELVGWKEQEQEQEQKERDKGTRARIRV